MVKGKYAAKAKNRLANLDNEILQEVIAERDRMKLERDLLSQELSELRREISSESMRKAGRLANQEIEGLQSKILEHRKEFDNDLNALLNHVSNSINRVEKILIDSSRMSAEEFALSRVGIELARVGEEIIGEFRAISKSELFIKNRNPMDMPVLNTRKGRRVSRKSGIAALNRMQNR